MPHSIAQRLQPAVEGKHSLQLQHALGKPKTKSHLATCLCASSARRCRLQRRRTQRIKVTLVHVHGRRRQWEQSVNSKVGPLQQAPALSQQQLPDVRAKSLRQLQHLQVAQHHSLLAAHGECAGREDSRVHVATRSQQREN